MMKTRTIKTPFSVALLLTLSVFIFSLATHFTLDYPNPILHLLVTLLYAPLAISALLLSTIALPAGQFEGHMSDTLFYGLFTAYYVEMFLIFYAFSLVVRLLLDSKRTSLAG